MYDLQGIVSGGQQLKGIPRLAEDIVEHLCMEELSHEVKKATDDIQEIKVHTNSPSFFCSAFAPLHYHCFGVFFCFRRPWQE